MAETMRMSVQAYFEVDAAAFSALANQLHYSLRPSALIELLVTEALTQPDTVVRLQKWAVDHPPLPTRAEQTLDLQRQRLHQRAANAEQARLDREARIRDREAQRETKRQAKLDALEALAAEQRAESARRQQLARDTIAMAHAAARPRSLDLGKAQDPGLSVTWTPPAKPTTKTAANRARSEKLKAVWKDRKAARLVDATPAPMDLDPDEADYNPEEPA